MVFNIQDSPNRNVKTDFEHTVNQLEHVSIPMPDGATLKAHIWLPDDANTNPVPALLEYLPYRKNDFTAIRDSARHPYFAGHGYASIRVDIRGSGDSDGVLCDEYLKQEQDDALAVIDWITAQPWSTGKVGMFGNHGGALTVFKLPHGNTPPYKR